MKLNRAELRKIMYDFNSISNRLLQADFNDYTNVVSKFVTFIKNTPVIFDYITDCGLCEQDLKKEFDEVIRACGGCIFSLGTTNEEEVRNVYGIMNYISDNNISIHYRAAMGCSSSSRYQDKIKGFNDRVVMVLIRHIESYLTKVGIDMGLDEKITYSISIQNGQVNIANDNAKITAANTVGIDAAQLAKLLDDVRITANGLSSEEAAILESNLDVIQEEIKTGRPRKSFLMTAISGLKILKSTAEFAAAVAALIQFIQPLIA